MSEFGKRLDGPGGRRCEAREPILLTAALLTVGCSRPIILTDVSKTGAQLRIHETIHRGQEVWIRIAPIEIFGTVVWVDEGLCGIAFDQPLGEAELAQVQARGKLTMVRRLSPEEQLAIEDWRNGLAR